MEFNPDDEDYSSEEELMLQAAQTIVAVAGAVVALPLAPPGLADHRSLPRGPRTRWRHEDALYCIQRDYLGIPGDPSTPLMKGDQFVTHFRIKKERFLKIMDHVANGEYRFYKYCLPGDTKNGTCASLEARLLLPLKSIAYGVPTHTFQDYFQMSKTLASDCGKYFDTTIKSLYEEEFLRIPTPEDLRSLLALHMHEHKVDGMFGSLDCMHTHWKNCPKAWQGQFQGKEGKPTIVLEAACDYNLWFWHASYGYAGTMNDLNILNMSPLLAAFKDGSFIELEKDVVPYSIMDQQFNHCFMLVDGIYPPYSRFVRSIPEPIGRREKKFSEWQESARKDIERAFGVFQAKFQIIHRPILLHNLDQIAAKVACTMILHNMCVSDRIMGDVDMRYNPSYKVIGADLVQEAGENIVQPNDLQEVQEQHRRSESRNRNMNNEEPAGFGIRGLEVRDVVELTSKERWTALKNVDDHNRLITALMDLKAL